MFNKGAQFRPAIPSSPVIDRAGVHGVDGRATLLESLQFNVTHRPNDLAFSFSSGNIQSQTSLTWQELHDQAQVMSRKLNGLGLHSSRCLLVLPNGLDFVITLVASLMSAIVLIPLAVPTGIREQRNIQRILAESTAKGVFALSVNLEAIRGELHAPADAPHIAWVAVDDMDGLSKRDIHGLPSASDPVLIQYTSGSTGKPKGIVLNHINFQMQALELEAQTPLGVDGVFVSWLPMFHDMGLMFGVIWPLISGRPVHLMTPTSFVRKPARWFDLIGVVQGTHAAIPNFALDYSVDSYVGSPDVHDLSSMRALLCGSETVRWHSIQKFVSFFAMAGLNPSSISPSYGLAENTLKAFGTDARDTARHVHVSANDLAEGKATPSAEEDDQSISLVSCGRPGPRTIVKIVDPVTRVECPPRTVGEIWVAGPCVASGYLNFGEANTEIFEAVLKEPLGDTKFLRTGDLGFASDDDFFVTGRIKDLIIVSGKNYHPEDLEHWAVSGLPGLESARVASFSVPGKQIEEVVVVIESKLSTFDRVTPGELSQLVEANIFTTFQISVHDICFVRKGTLPKTTSGKTQRGESKRLYLSNELSLLKIEV